VLLQVFEKARVVRVDNGLGVMVELPQENGDVCRGTCLLSFLLICTQSNKLPMLFCASRES